MPKQAGAQGFGGHIQRIVAELAQAELAPDVPPDGHDFINQLRTQIIAYHQQGLQGGQGQPQAQPQAQPQIPGMNGLQGQMQGPPGSPPGMPTVDAEGLSRGPNPNPDMGGASSELARIMNGQ